MPLQAGLVPEFKLCFPGLSADDEEAGDDLRVSTGMQGRWRMIGSSDSCFKHSTHPKHWDEQLGMQAVVFSHSPT